MATATKIVMDYNDIQPLADAVKTIGELDSSEKITLEDMIDIVSDVAENGTGGGDITIPLAELNAVNGGMAATTIEAAVDNTEEHAADHEELIAQISAALEGKTTATKDVVFYDYDGTVICSYTIEEAKALTQMPTPPAHEGLVFQGWNHTLNAVNELVYPTAIGAIYITDDGKTRLYVHLEEGFTDINIGVQLLGTMIIDWGDGTPSDTLTIPTSKYESEEFITSPTHYYASEGDYVITLEVNGHALFTQWYWGVDYTSNLLFHIRDGSETFYNAANTLTKVEIGNNIGFFGNSFAKCHNLLSVTIPNGIDDLGESTFMECTSLVHVNVPMSVIYEFTRTFCICTNLLSISIPCGETYSGEQIGGSLYAFEGCANLKRITAPSNIVSYDGSTFSGCSSLKDIYIIYNSEPSHNYYYDCEELFYDCKSLLHVILQDGLSKIGYAAFEGCHSIKNILIPDSVNEIGDRVFRNCWNLRKIDIPRSVSRIGNGVFGNCYSLSEIHMKSSTPPVLDDAHAFSEWIPLNIYVPHGSLNAYKTATNWSYYADRIREEGT